MIVQDPAHFSHFLIAHLIVVPPLMRRDDDPSTHEIPHMFAIRVNLREEIFVSRKMIVDFLLQNVFQIFSNNKRLLVFVVFTCRHENSSPIFQHFLLWERIIRCKINQVFSRSKIFFHYRIK